jgi:hypothetical protein
VSLARTATAATGVGTLDLPTDWQFVLRETGGGTDRTFTGTYVVRPRDGAMRLTLDSDGMSALAAKVGEMAASTSVNEAAQVQSIDVWLSGVSRPLLRRPPVGRTRTVSFRATGTYRVTWRYDAGFPFPPYFDVTVWRFAFRQVVVVGPGT